MFLTPGGGAWLELKMISLCIGNWLKFSSKGLEDKLWGFEISVISAQLCHCREEAAADNKGE